MHQLVALVLFLVLSVHGAPDTLVTPEQRIAYVAGGIIARVSCFLVVHGLVYLGARLLSSKETYASFFATRLNYLTLAILLLVEASAPIGR